MVVAVALRLNGPYGRYVELEVLGYQFPGDQKQGLGRVDNDWDANWLMVRLRVSDGREVWSRTEPVLLTWEIRRLARWLAIIAGGKRPDPDAWTGLEPNLQLEVTKTPMELIASLHQEFRRPGSALEEEPTSIELKPTPAEIASFIAGLEETLLKYPIRFIEENGPAHFHSNERWPPEPEPSSA